MSNGRRAQRVMMVSLLAVLGVLLAVFCIQYVRRETLLSRPVACLHAEGDFGYIAPAEQELTVTLASPQAFVYDCQTQRLLYRKGEVRVVYPASTTKLLTVLCALEHLSLDETVTPGEELSLMSAGSSVAYIKPNHTLTVEMLIEGVLLPSGNDAAFVLAAAAGNRISGGRAVGVAAVDVFMQEMQAYGTRIGLVGTNFTSPDGFSDKEHYSTVEDILLIARLAAQNETVSRYAALHEDDVTYVSGHTNHWVNTNEMLDPDSPYYHAAVTGLKTGSLESNYCLICTLTLDGADYIVGVFGARQRSDRYTDVLAVIDALSSNGMSGEGRT